MKRAKQNQSKTRVEVGYFVLYTCHVLCLNIEGKKMKLNKLGILEIRRAEFPPAKLYSDLLQA